MRRSKFLPLAILALSIALPLTLKAPDAFAFSVDRTSGTNSDGTAKFADPDDQMPGFMTPPSQDQSGAQARPDGVLSMAPGANANVSAGRFGQQQQPDAFDQAFQQK